MGHLEKLMARFIGNYANERNKPSINSRKTKKIERKKGKTIIVDDSAHPWTYVHGHGDLKIDYRFN